MGNEILNIFLFYKFSEKKNNIFGENGEKSRVCAGTHGWSETSLYSLYVCGMMMWGW